MAPLSMPPHDMFLTVDLYEAKDPAQVLQCISAFSRRANVVKPSNFPATIGAKSKGGVMSPQMTGNSQSGLSSPGIFPPSRDRGISNVSDQSATTWNPLAKGSFASGRTSPTKNGGPGSPPSGISSWSKKGDETSSAPAWNIHQYGYMGGASQGNQGISFGARRQITSAAPSVPSMAEKDRKRKEEAAEAELQRRQQEEAEHQARLEREAEEERARLEEERRWEEETRRLREKERREAEEEKRRWDEEQRRWKEEEEARAQEEKAIQARLDMEKARSRANSDARLNGQFLSQYQSQQGSKSRNVSGEGRVLSPESQRIKDLERELELAKERERQYEHERQERMRSDRPKASYTRARSRSRPRLPERPPQDDVQNDEREYLQGVWQAQNQAQAPPKPPRPTPAEPAEPVFVKKNNTGPSARPLPSPGGSRPLPDPTNYTPNTNRTDRYLSTNPAPVAAQAASHRPSDYSTTTEVDLENERRKASQAKTKASGWASKSLLEREMERERERQREWEEGQKQTQAAPRDTTTGSRPGQSWDVHQYGYMGGDSQNRGGSGLGVGGARRQIIGPRPPP